MKMTFSLLEDQILHEILQGPQTLETLLTRYTKQRGVSRAGFYKALGSLKNKEVVTEQNRTIAINKVWLAEATSFFKSLSSRKSEPSYLARQVAALGTEDELVYRFSSIAEIDLFLINLIYDLLLLDTSKSVFIDEQHEFFLLLNRRRTDTFMREIRPLAAKLFLLIHSNSAIDRELVRQDLAAPGQGYVTGTERLSIKIMHIVGDIGIELTLDKTFAREIHALYTKHTTISEKLVDAVEELAGKKQRHRIRIYKDAKQATTLQARIEKYFVL